VLSHDKVLVLVKEVVCLVGDRASVVLDGESCLAQLGALEPLAAAHCVCAVQLLGQVLRTSINTNYCQNGTHQTTTDPSQHSAGSQLEHALSCSI